MTTRTSTVDAAAAAAATRKLSHAQTGKDANGAHVDAAAMAAAAGGGNAVSNKVAAGGGGGGVATPATEEAMVERILRAGDPNVMSTPVYYDFRKEARVYKFLPSVASTAAHLSIDGVAVRVDGAEAQQQSDDRARRQREVVAAAAAEQNPDLLDEGVSTRILKNQFNYSDRGSQTMNQPLRERQVMTDPPPSISFGGLASAWSIYDAYEAERLQSEKAAHKKAAAAHRSGREDDGGGSSGGGGGGVSSMMPSSSAGGAGGRGGGGGGLSSMAAGGGGGGGVTGATGSAAAAVAASGGSSAAPHTAADVMATTHFLRALKLVERMVNQNDCFDIIDDYKYWEDQSDLYKEDGTLLPLWQFATHATRRHAVTSIALNTRYSDLFAVGYGSYEFQRPCRGTIHCYTLKNAVPSGNSNINSNAAAVVAGGASSSSSMMMPAHPEFTFYADSGVLCLAFHPHETALLAAGLYSGAVCVYDLRVCDEAQRYRPRYQSSIRHGAHTDPLWDVYWSPSTAELACFTISTDGRVVKWVLQTKEMTASEVLRLNTGVCTADPEAMALSRLGGTCMDYSPAHDALVVGTQEGRVLLCTMARHGQCDAQFAGHTMPVYTARWNPYHADLFITCSADWTVKLWLRTSPQPLLTFDLGDSVSDVAWAPYSSTVFAAVTGNGKVYVYDLHVNKTEPLCVQTVVKNAKLTHVVFSSSNPVLFVGDTRGTVLTLKLSPNLRKTGSSGSGSGSSGSKSTALRKDAVVSSSSSTAAAAAASSGAAATLTSADGGDVTEAQVQRAKLTRLVDITLKDRALLAAM